MSSIGVKRVLQGISVFYLWSIICEDFIFLVEKIFFLDGCYLLLHATKLFSIWFHLLELGQKLLYEEVYCLLCVSQIRYLLCSGLSFVLSLGLRKNNPSQCCFDKDSTHYYFFKFYIDRELVDHITLAMLIELIWMNAYLLLEGSKQFSAITVSIFGNFYWVWIEKFLDSVGALTTTDYNSLILLGVSSKFPRKRGCYIFLRKVSILSAIVVFAREVVVFWRNSNW